MTSIFDPNVAKHMSYLEYFVVPEDMVDNYIVFVNKTHYIDCLIKELGNPIPEDASDRRNPGESLIWLLFLWYFNQI